MKAVILAAGYATRLYPLTKDQPKALLEVKRKKMIDYIVEEFETVDTINEIIVISNHKFFGHFSDWAKNLNCKIKITVLDDGTETEETRLGAIGDIYFTIQKQNIDEDICVIASDNLFTYKLSDVYDYFKKENTDCVVAKEIADYELLKSFAVAKIDEENVIVNLVEKPAEPPSNLAVYATYFYKKETLPLFKQYLDEGNKPDAPGYFVQWLYKRKPVKTFIMDGVCYDIGTLKAYEEVNQTFTK